LQKKKKGQKTQPNNDPQNTFTPKKPFMAIIDFGKKPWITVLSYRTTTKSICWSHPTWCDAGFEPVPNKSFQGKTILSWTTHSLSHYSRQKLMAFTVFQTRYIRLRCIKHLF